MDGTVVEKLVKLRDPFAKDPVFADVTAWRDNDPQWATPGKYYRE
jgi:hypothetical protein